MKILLLGASKTGTTAITYAIHQYLPNHEIIFEPASLQKINYEKSNVIVKYLNVRDWKAITEYSKNFDRILRLWNLIQNSKKTCLKSF
jgi:hypothetical protein